jgi:hypothetical protein
MHDVYAVADEAEDFARWQATGGERDADPGSEYWRPWVDLIRDVTGRGVAVRRARVVAEPVSAYIRFEHAGTVVNLAAGEEVRWLPRRLASDLALPGNDFWIIDSRAIRFNLFNGDGDLAEPQYTEDPATAKLCAEAFEAVWGRAIPHDQFVI